MADDWYALVAGPYPRAPLSRYVITLHHGPMEITTTWCRMTRRGAYRTARRLLALRRDENYIDLHPRRIT